MLFAPHVQEGGTVCLKRQEAIAIVRHGKVSFTPQLNANEGCLRWLLLEVFARSTVRYTLKDNS